jgi:hypothetical protein
MCARLIDMSENFLRRFLNAVELGKTTKRLERSEPVTPQKQEENVVPEKAGALAMQAEVNSVLTKADLDIVKGKTEGA